MLIAFFAACLLSNNFYHISSELITVYISVLGIFALTQKSKKLYKIKRK